MGQDKKEVLLQSDLQKTFNNLEQVVEKKFLQNILEYPIVATSDDSAPEKYVRIKQVFKIVFDKNEDIEHKLTHIYSTLHSLGGSAVLILHSDGTYVEFYIGVKSNNGNADLKVLNNGFSSVLNGNFPGCKVSSKFDNNQIKNLVHDKIFGNTYENMAISMANGIPKLKNSDDKESFAQGLEKFIEAMNGKKYSAIFIADQVSEQAIAERRLAYEQIYSSLLPFASQQMTLGLNESVAFSEGISSSFTHSTNETLTKTQSSTTGISESTTLMESIFHDTGKVASQLARAVMGGSSSKSSSETNGQSETNGSSDSNTEGKTSGKSTTTGTSETYQITYENKTVKNLLEKIDNQINRIIESENYGMFDYAVYFISESYEDARIAANTYKTLIRGEESSLERSSVISWDTKDSNKLISYLKNFQHPRIFLDTLSMEITPTSLVSSKELSLAMNFPRKSISGVAIEESVEFGRSIHLLNQGQSAKCITLGKLSHLGKVEENIDINLDLKSLGMHTLVTGSTGAGKSNTLYTILNEANKKGVKFLVIEPAKGEYKEVFGGRDDVSVYGTNSKYSKVLRINPFSFHDEIHVLEHIDRLVEIFNACWPMYAAMPEVLKEAIIKSYEECGWDTDESYSVYEIKRFPTFKLLLSTLKQIIDNSEYSEEMKSNYKGALLTRVKSLNNGLIGQILNSADPIEDDKLFDSNVIVDLSRIGAMESKSLLMGMLTLRLLEYRYANQKQSNSELKHITVLEEAHNLLKRTSTEQSAEGSNLQGKSVEMISNAIAEMRTYGEGFIIVDQSPNMLDISAIRNTGTKIIMRLPEYSDRNDIGKSAALNDDQIGEIPKLPTGSAVVYQNNWLEAVLCQIDVFKEEDFHPFSYSRSLNDIDYNKKQFLSDVLQIIFYEKLDDQNKSEVEKINMAFIKSKVKQLNISNFLYSPLVSKLDNFDTNMSKEEKAKLVNDLLDGDKILLRLKGSENMEDYNATFSKILQNELSIDNPIIENHIKELILYSESISTKGFEHFYTEWHEENFKEERIR